MVAVPAEVNCAVPISAGALRQYGAAALQKITVPAVTGDPLDTVAVNVTTVPETTEETEDEEAVSASVVARRFAPAPPAHPPPPPSPSSRRIKSTGVTSVRRTMTLHALAELPRKELGHNAKRPAHNGL
jgi:hypothetical protein